jgi:cell division protein FtsI (penicillin-binding protein 3)
MKMWLRRAIEEKVMTPDSMVFGENGHMVIANTTIRHDKLGWMTFSEMIQSPATLAGKPEWLEQRPRYLQAFGFGTYGDHPGE